ncbi:MAG: methylmalonyl-CoA mutase family protein [Prevotellaceae bacterium]|jgi:methylmalonyl-CoA mutase|nr:methylmalonyl-CoA mutase family protein [Prevotellaceae bacterium]
MSNKKLFTEFSPVLTEQWEEVITRDLKGADYDKKLVWKTAEGIAVRPYYRAEDLKRVKHMDTEQVGRYPFVRGTKADNSWLVRQRYCACADKKKANAQALDGMMRGVSSLSFCTCGVPTQEEFDQLMKGIYADAVEVNFVGTGCKASLALIEMMTAYAKKTNAKPDNVCGSTGFDPLKKLTQKGYVGEHAFEKIKTQILAAKELKRWRVIGVSGSAIHNAGGTIVQELAFALVMGNEYLSRLTDMGLTVDEVARRMKFTFSVGSTYFMEIAKFRAARMLWANIVNAYKPEKECSERMKIHAVTSARNQTGYDAYVNMLRGTTEAMSAALAGVDSLEVLPFDASFQASGEFSDRIARNTQILLKEESHFDQVVDPAAGSYYIETLTQSIAEEAWKLFKQVEEKGGYTAAFKAGFIQEQVKASAQKRDSNIATRREILLGTNQYPNFTETLKEESRKTLIINNICGCDENCDCISDEKNSSTCGCSSDAKPEQMGEPLKRYRGAQAFEAMRMKTENSGKQPHAFMLTFGNLAMCRARAQFASNFFAIAGFKVVDNNRFGTIEEGVKAAFAAKADIIIACSSDDEYAEAVPQIAEKLGKNGILVVAGDPACKADLEAKGITHFVNVKSNVLETLRQYQKELGI